VSARARRQAQPIEAEEIQDLDEQEAADQRDAAREAERERLARRQEELARQREQEREAARLRAQQETEARARREAAEQRAKQQRRNTIQRVKSHVVGGGWSAGHPIPSERQAQALAEIEKELSRLPVEELPESELITIAEGIRDRIYQPVIRAQERAREEEDRKQKQARQRADLIASGVAYASQELRREQDLDGWTRLHIEQKVKRILEEDLDGSESQAEVRTLVDETLEQELDDAEEERQKKARARLIAHGAAYASRELARQKDLDATERWQIEGAVKKELEREITGEESERDVEAFVDEILDEELGEAEEDDEGC